MRSQMIGMVIDGTTDKATGKTTSHSARPPKNGVQAAGYSHLTGKTTSQSTKPPKNGGKVAGYNPASEKLLDGHPKDAGQVIGYSHHWSRHPG